MNFVQVFHPLHGYAMCYGPAEILPPSEVGIVEHGMLVRCRVCQRLGDDAQPLADPAADQHAVLHDADL